MSEYASLLIHDITTARRSERINIIIKSNGRRPQDTSLLTTEQEATDTM